MTSDTYLKKHDQRSIGIGGSTTGPSPLPELKHGGVRGAFIWAAKGGTQELPANPMLRPGRTRSRAAHPFDRPVSANYKATSSDQKKKMTGDGRRRRVCGATKPPTPRLAVVEAVEQAQELRVGGAGARRR
jgi:hypothetical protein